MGNGGRGGDCEWGVRRWMTHMVLVTSCYAFHVFQTGMQPNLRDIINVWIKCIHRCKTKSVCVEYYKRLCYFLSWFNVIQLHSLDYEKSPGGGDIMFIFVDFHMGNYSSWNPNYINGGLKSYSCKILNFPWGDSFNFLIAVHLYSKLTCVGPLSNHHYASVKHQHVKPAIHVSWKTYFGDDVTMTFVLIYRHQKPPLTH